MVHRICYALFSLLYTELGASFQLFLGANIFFIFQCHRTIEKLEKQHYMYSNLTLFIVPFFLSFFSFFLFFFLFFLFFFFLGGAMAPSPPQMTPLHRMVRGVVRTPHRTLNILHRTCSTIYLVHRLVHRILGACRFHRFRMHSWTYRMFIIL